jgi:RNA polymerase sigma-70 factor (ECF subfamily)
MGSSASCDAERSEVALLVGRITAGDQAAEEELYTRFNTPVEQLLRRRSGDDALAEDLRQETFRIVLQRLRTRALDCPERVLPFLFGTAIRLLYAERRRMARVPSSSDLAHLIDPRGTPLTDILSSERTELLRHGLSILIERDRQILWRYYILGDEKEHIRRDLDVKPLHFNRVLFRARERLRHAVDHAEHPHR